MSKAALRCHRQRDGINSVIKGPLSPLSGKPIKMKGPQDEVVGPSLGKIACRDNLAIGLFGLVFICALPVAIGAGDQEIMRTHVWQGFATMAAALMSAGVWRHFIGKPC